RELEPPDPIPNSAVKRLLADGSVGFPHVRVGHRQAPKTRTPIRFSGLGFCLFCPEKGSAVAPQAWQPQLQRSALGDGFPGGHQLAFLGVPAPFSHLTVGARTNDLCAFFWAHEAEGRTRRPWTNLPFALNATWIILGSRRMARSEEHTSELQSRDNLVCRLLLEKKK